MERLGLKFVVSEQSGIRRFLYPMRVRIPQVYRRSVGRLAVADDSGALAPSHAAITPDGIECSFAISLGPFETREVTLVRSDADVSPNIPDPLQVAWTGEEFVIKQTRLCTKVGRRTELQSVVYDSAEHLASPLAITLDGAKMHSELPSPVRCDRPASGLGALFESSGVYEAQADGRIVAARTEVELTCCKSWATVRHTLADVLPGSVLRFSLPLALTSDVQTCDFGIGNGAYGKIQAGAAQAVLWDVDLFQGGPARYRIRTQTGSGDLRTDYTGQIASVAKLARLLWLHWIEPTKSLALAVTEFGTGCERIRIRLDANGVIDTEFVLGETICDPARFGVCYHFLNGVPAVAAATNPASILSPPKVTVSKADF